MGGRRACQSALVLQKISLAHKSGTELGVRASPFILDHHDGAVVPDREGPEGQGVVTVMYGPPQFNNAPLCPAEVGALVDETLMQETSQQP